MQTKETEDIMSQSDFSSLWEHESHTSHPFIRIKAEPQPDGLPVKFYVLHASSSTIFSLFNHLFNFTVNCWSCCIKPPLTAVKGQRGQKQIKLLVCETLIMSLYITIYKQTLTFMNNILTMCFLSASPPNDLWPWKHFQAFPAQNCGYVNSHIVHGVIRHAVSSLRASCMFITEF